MAFGRHIYNALFRRTSTFALTIVVGAVLFERVFDQALDNHYERVNQGVCIPYDVSADLDQYICILNFQVSELALYRTASFI
jgi:ubiquinol-cytochrome c reductase subunit 9